MVKPLRICGKCLKWFVLMVLLVLIWGAVWLRQGEHSFGYLKPFILRSINSSDAAYTVDFDTVSIDWQNWTELGKIGISHVTFATRAGDVFARLPEVYATIDPIGFLPHRRTLNRVILRGPHLFINRSAEGVLQVGLEGSDSSIAMSDLFSTLGDGDSEDSKKPISLPFRNFVIQHGSIKFHDAKTGTDIASRDFGLSVIRQGSHYGAKFVMPFLYGEGQGQINAALIADAKDHNYHIDTTLTQFPSSLICTFGFCPENVKMEGLWSGALRIGITPNGTLLSGWANLTTSDFVFTAPHWFEKPLAMDESSFTVAYDVAEKTVTLSESKLSLEDTPVAIKAVAHQAEDGWYVDATGEAGPLDISKLHKYWPITMAHDTRLWVTSKIKSGHSKGTAHIKLTPKDIAAGELSDESLSADVTTHDTSVDYLPGFPEIQHLDGEVHFTGSTVKVTARNGTMLDGTKVTKAVLWCPELNNPKNPMETSITAEMPMKDVATLLQQKIFTFDDALNLDPSKIKGSTVSTVQLKFDAFSGNSNDPDPNAIHLEAVDYSIKSTIANFAQNDIAGGYDVRNLSGELTADNKSTQFSGNITLGESGASNVTINRRDGKPLVVDVKATEPGKPANDFKLTYLSAAVPEMALEGKHLDVSASYGGTKNSLLKDFPPIRLNINLDELLIAPGAPFRAVKGTLFCNKERCESAHFRAAIGKGQLAADITKSGGIRQLTFTASDAGELVKELDITDRMIGGKLTLQGTYDDTKSPAPLNAKLNIQEFTLKNSQILGRILSIGSLTGLSNALTGSGIAFDKMTMGINSRAGIITLIDGRANGTAMGITVAGTVDTTSTKLNLKGVVVPAYALNSMLGRIPILGALAGGEGEGLIAFNYSVHGTYAEPDVSVNPLSGLTPGFLRGIFGIFNQPADKPAEKPKPKSIPTNFNLPDKAEPSAGATDTDKKTP